VIGVLLLQHFLDSVVDKSTSWIDHVSWL